MDCKEAQKLIPAYLSEELDGKTEEAFLNHIEECAICKEELCIQYLVEEGTARLEDGSSFDLNRELESKIAELNDTIKANREYGENAENFVDLIKQYADIDELTQALLNTLIERIEVHEPEEIDGERIQKLDVYYKFVGRLD